MKLITHSLDPQPYKGNVEAYVVLRGDGMDLRERVVLNPKQTPQSQRRLALQLQTCSRVKKKKRHCGQISSFLPEHQDGIMHMLCLREERLTSHEVRLKKHNLHKTTCRVMMTIQAERQGTAIEKRIPARL